jgi:C_GCAxxG_C_C family probable redox protein
MDRAKKAYENMTEKKGNCAQSTFTAFSSDFGVDEKTAFNLTQAFGGGMHIDGVCGAVTGAYLALGLANPIDKEDPKKSGEKFNALIAEFNHRFKEMHGALTCTELLGYNLTVPEQAAKAREIGIFTEKCPVFVRDAAQIVEDLLKQR